MSAGSLEGLDPVKAPVPEFEQGAFDLAMKRCRDNVCGSYDTNWGCSPGAKRDIPAFYAENDFVIVVNKVFELDWHDKEKLDRTTKGMQERIRAATLEMRELGYTCTGFMDGPCIYCAKCAYPDPCRHPDMLLPSVSTLGIDLEKYFASFGRPFAFTEGRITLYGFLFIRDPSLHRRALPKRAREQYKLYMRVG